MKPRRPRNEPCRKCGGTGCIHCGGSGKERKRRELQHSGERPAVPEHPAVMVLDTTAHAWAVAEKNPAALDFAHAVVAFAREVNAALTNEPAAKKGRN